MKTLAILISAAALSGCATNSNDAYIAAHQSANEWRANETKARVDLDSAKAKAIALMAVGCMDSGCLGMAMMSMSQLGKTEAVINTPAPTIAAPVNEFTDFIKTVGNIAVPIYSLWSGAVTGVVNATRGPADASVARTGLGVLTPKLGGE